MCDTRMAGAQAGARVAGGQARWHTRAAAVGTACVHKPKQAHIFAYTRLFWGSLAHRPPSMSARPLQPLQPLQILQLAPRAQTSATPSPGPLAVPANHGPLATCAHKTPHPHPKRTPTPTPTPTHAHTRTANVYTHTPARIHACTHTGANTHTLSIRLGAHPHTSYVTWASFPPSISYSMPCRHR